MFQAENLSPRGDRRDEALRRFDAVLDYQKKVQGPDHLDTQETCWRFADWLRLYALQLLNSREKTPGDNARGLAAADKALLVWPIGLLGHLVRCWGRYCNGDLPGALEDWDRSARTDDTWPGQYFIRALCLHHQGHKDAARDWYAVGRHAMHLPGMNDPQAVVLREETRALLGLPSSWHVPLADVAPRVLQDCPRGPASASLHTMLGNTDKAEADLTFAIQAQPRVPWLYDARANFLVRRGRWKEAEADLARVADLYPANCWKLFQLAPLRLFLGDEAGHQALRQTMLNRWGHDRHLWLFELVSQANTVAPVPAEDLPRLRSMTEGLPLVGGSQYNLLAHGMVLYREDQLPEAVKVLQRVPPGESHATALVFLAMACHRLGQRPLATEYLAQARNAIFADCLAARRGNFPLNGYHHGRVFLAFAPFTEATQFLEDYPRDALRADMLALVDVPKAAPGAALPTLDKLLARYPDCLPLLRERGHQWLRQGQSKEAAADYTRAYGLEPTEFWTARRIACLLHETDPPAYRKHCAALRRHLAAVSGQQPFALVLEALLIDPQPVEDPKALLTQAEIVLRPENAGPVKDQADLLLGLAYLRAGREDDAAHRLQAAHKATLDSPEVPPAALCALAVARARQGQEDLARQHLRQAAEILARTPREQADDVLSPHWDRRRLCDILRREAEEVLKAAPAKPSPPPAKDKAA